MGTNGKIGAKRLSQLYDQKAFLSTKSEKVSESFVYAACTVSARAFSLAPVSVVLLALEQDFGMQGPFGECGVYKLEAVVKKAPTPAMI